MPMPRSGLRFFLSFSFAENIGAKVVNIFRKILTDENSGKMIKIRDNPSFHRVRSSLGHMEDVCKIFKF